VGIQEFDSRPGSCVSYLAVPAAVPVMKFLRLACSLYPDVIDGIRCMVTPCQLGPQAGTSLWPFSVKVLGGDVMCRVS